MSAPPTVGRDATVSAVLTVAPTLTIKTLHLTAAKLGRAYQAKLVTAGGVQPVRWTLRGRLPFGVRFAKRVGALVGTPRRMGTFRVTVEARDALGAKSQKTLVLLVKS